MLSPSKPVLLSPPRTFSFFRPESFGWAWDPGCPGIPNLLTSFRLTPPTPNPQRRVLFQLLSNLNRAIPSRWARKLKRRLCLSRSNAPPLSLSRLSALYRRRATKEKISKKMVLVVPSTVVDDPRGPPPPQGLRLSALRITRKAARRVAGVGGEVLTLDQVLAERPRGSHTWLLRGRRSRRKEVKRFGIPGQPGSHAQPKDSGRKKEKVRGGTGGRAWKVKAFKYAQR